MTVSRERIMSKTKRLFRFWGGMAVVIGLLLLAVMALGGCAGPAAITVVEPTATLYPLPPTDIPAPTPGPTPAAMDFPIAAPTREPVEQVEANDHTCVDCHTSQQVLQAMATEEEAPEVESEGEG